MPVLGFKRIVTSQVTGNSTVVSRIILNTDDRKQIDLANAIGRFAQRAAEGAKVLAGFDKVGNLDMDQEVFLPADEKERPAFDVQTMTYLP
jgi:hypothetical protein